MVQESEANMRHLATRPMKYSDGFFNFLRLAFLAS